MPYRKLRWPDYSPKSNLVKCASGHQPTLTNTIAQMNHPLAEYVTQVRSNPTLQETHDDDQLNSSRIINRWRNNFVCSHEFGLGVGPLGSR